MVVVVVVVVAASVTALVERTIGSSTVSILIGLSVEVKSVPAVVSSLFIVDAAKPVLVVVASVLVSSRVTVEGAKVVLTVVMVAMIVP